jgi:glucose/arabinose dehydrogenase
MRVVVLFVSLTLAAAAAGASPKTDKVIENVRLPTASRWRSTATRFLARARWRSARRARCSSALASAAVRFTRSAARPATRTKPTVRVIADNLNTPNGVAFHDGALYVAEINRLLRFDDIEASLDNVPQPKVVRDDLPKDGHHGWRYIAFGPDDKLYFPIGAPCNVCNEPKYAMITRMNADGSGQEVFARGVRNTVGFTWHPSRSSSGSPTTAATGSAKMRRHASSTSRRAPGSISASRTATARTSRIPSSASSATAARSRRRRSCSARTSRRSV